MHDYRKLRVWQEGRAFVREVYSATAFYPESELFGLVTQSQRAAVAIPANIAEGSGRSTQRDYARFVDIALGSAFELETLLLLGSDLGFLAQDRLDQLLERLGAIQRMLVRFRQRLRPPRKRP